MNKQELKYKHIPMLLLEHGHSPPNDNYPEQVRVAEQDDAQRSSVKSSKS